MSIGYRITLTLLCLPTRCVVWLSLLRVDEQAIVFGHGECVFFWVPCAHRDPLWQIVRRCHVGLLTRGTLRWLLLILRILSRGAVRMLSGHGCWASCWAVCLTTTHLDVAAMPPLWCPMLRIAHILRLLRQNRLLHLRWLIRHWAYQTLVLVWALIAAVLSSFVHISHVNRSVDAPLKI